MDAAMITLPVLLAFIAATGLLAVTPGPNMSLIIANTLSGGLRHGMLTLAGALTGNTVLVAAAAIGMSSLMLFMIEWFDIIRWAGALYLLILGARQLWLHFSRSSGVVAAPVSSGGSAFVQGMFVSLSNPKVLLFLGAFLPQFVDASRDPLPQLRTLAMLFILVLAVVDVAYTFAIARARRTFPAGKLRALDGFAGALLVMGGLMLMAVRRPT
jgi:homoserine/homoserine lactone efflux protein